jgi:GNAT superfamily N-acetyltransferase
MAAISGVVSTRALPAQVAIRPFRRDDSIEELTSLLHRAYAALARAGLNYTAAEQAPAITRMRVEHGQCFVAVERRELVGTVLVNSAVPNFLGECFGRPRVASIHQLAVAPRRQSSGIGSLLLLHAESWLKRLGFAEAALDTAQSAPQLIAFFVRRGYRSVSSVQWNGKAYRSVIMSKELREAR